MTGDKRPRKPTSTNTPKCPTTGKYAHKTREAAQKFADRVNGQASAKRETELEQYPFDCPHCRWWHLARRKRRRIQ